jgi:transposase
MKARYQYRFYPTDQQRQSLAQLFGCVRVVWNDALALCKQSEKKPKSAELQKVAITQAKRTTERAWLTKTAIYSSNLLPISTREKSNFFIITQRYILEIKLHLLFYWSFFLLNILMRKIKYLIGKR